MNRQKKFHRVAVLMGGGSTEREISLLSGKAVLEALLEAGYDAVGVEVGRDNSFTLPEGTQAVYIVLHGAFGEDGGVQARLNEMEMPYIGCGEESSRISFDKALSRAALAAAGVPVPEGYVISRKDAEGFREPKLPLPLVVKATRQGSSVGVSIVREPSQWEEAVQTAFRYDAEAVVERFIPGREWSIPVLGRGEILPAMEITPKVASGWYDWKAKYADGAGTAYEFPQDNPADAALVRRAEEIALAAYRALGSRGVARIDERITPEGEIFVLESNTIPGCTSHSILPKSAQKAGISFPELVTRIVEDSQCD